MPIKHLARSGGATAVTLAILVLLSAGAAFAQSPSRMLTILSSSDTETQAMALVLSNQAAQSGTPVHLLLCGAAGDIALDSPPEPATKVVTPKGMSVRALLEGLMKKGATVDVCAIYLPNRKLTLEALIDGVGAAKPPAIAAEMLSSEIRLATF